jgi:hypothetical protein
MDEILRSRHAMVLATLAAVLAVVAEVIGVVGFATLDVRNPGAFADLGHAHDWLFFAGWVLGLGAVGLATWERIVADQQGVGPANAITLELIGASVATLLLALGSLVSAASSGSSAGDTLSAVGIGLWGLLALSRAGRENLADRQAAGHRSGRQSALWLAVSAGVVLLAVGSGIAFDPSNQGSSMASGILSAVGVGVWATATAVARRHGLLRSSLVPRIVVALVLGAASYIAQAVLAGVVFGPNGTVTGLRIGGAILLALLGLSLGCFGSAAWVRVVELLAAVGPDAPVLTVDAPSDRAPLDPTPPPAPASFCAQCGSPLTERARYCWSCGAPVQAVGP